MHKQNAQKPSGEELLRRCAVLKVDFHGRFVYVDDLAEQLLGAPGENLFGRSIKEFLDEDSYQILLSVLGDSNRCESIFRAASFVFIDSRRDRHLHEVVISLNFIAGNPANYQIIINPAREAAHGTSESGAAERTARLLFTYASSTEGSADWKELCNVFLQLEDVDLVEAYRFKDAALSLLASRAASESIEKSSLLGRTGDHHMTAAVEKKVYVDTCLADENTGEKLVDACYPLICTDECWGVLRIIHHGDQSGLDAIVKPAAKFLGNALFTYICMEQPRETVPV